MNDNQIRKVTDAIASALRQSGGKPCCEESPVRPAEPCTVHVTLSGCCEPDAATPDAAQTCGCQVVCVCLGDAEKGS